MQYTEISKGKLEDVDSILEMFNSITDLLLKMGVDQWNYDYPDKTTLTEDVNAGHCYVIKEGNKIVASIVVNDIQDPQYQNIQWSIESNSVLVIHRLGVHPESQGMGFGKKMCLFAEEFGSINGFDCIRLDAYSGNEISNRLYISLGYSLADGLCYFRNKTIPFNCYEKPIEEEKSKDHRSDSSFLQDI